MESGERQMGSFGRNEAAPARGCRAKPSALALVGVAVDLDSDIQGRWHGLA